MLGSSCARPTRGRGVTATRLQAVREELEKTAALISVQPGVGARARDIDLPGVRRIHIERIRYYIYYRVVGSPEYIEVLAFWSSLRGSPPPI